MNLRRAIATVSLFVAAIFFLPQSASAATVNYYVDPTLGTNSGPGTSAGAGAWQTIQYAIDTVSNPTSDVIIINLAADTFTTNNDDISIDRNFANLTLRGQSASSTIVQSATSAASSTARVMLVGTFEFVTFEKMTIRYGRITTGHGAAISQPGSGRLTIRDTLIEDNDGSGASVSGGVYSVSPTYIERSTFLNNNGTYNGALYVSSASTTITNSTFYNNTATSQGLYFISGDVTMTNSTVASSSFYQIQGTQTVRIKNSIILGNQGGAALYYYTFTGTVVDGGTNIVGGEAGSAGDVGPYFTNGVNGTIKVSNSSTTASIGVATTTADNGSVNGVPTLALQSGSIAINAGSGGGNGGVTVPAIDARGLYRGTIPDIGSYEYNAAPAPLSYSAPTVAATNISTGIISNASTTISWTNGNGDMRAVFMKANVTTGEAVPVNGTVYEASNTFGSGNQIGSSGWYAVYNGTSTSAIVSNLDFTKNYRIHVVEYNGPYDGTPQYFATAGTGNPSTLAAYVANTIYSNSSTGSDTTGNGSSGNPYQTFHKAYTVANDGDILNLDGTFSWSSAGETGDVSTYGYRLYKSLTVRGQSASTTIIQAYASLNVSNDRRLFTLYQPGITLTFENLNIRHGDSTSFGGCFGFVSAASTTLNIRNSSVNSCRTRNGGSPGGSAIYANVGSTTLRIDNSSFTGNIITSSANGGAIYSSGTGNTFYITNTTFTGNQMGSGQGSSVSMGAGHAYLTNVTIARNTGGASALSVLSNASISFKNTIIADSLTSSFYRSGGNFISNGYNIIGPYSSTYFTASTTGDWMDATGSSTFRLYGSATTGTLSLSASTTASNGTIYVPLNIGSLGIDNGTTTAHGIVSIPTLDQLSYSRSAIPDIGAFEYGGTATDVTGPVISSIASTTSESTATITWTTDESATSTLDFGFDTSYGTASSSAVGATSHSVSLSGLTPSTLYHFRISVWDTASNQTVSSDYTFTTSHSLASPTPSSVVAVPSADGAAITWTTPLAASSRVHFGPTSSLASSTAEADTATRVTSHSMALSGLPACTLFYYEVTGKSAALISATSSAGTFKTTGCTGNASITASQTAGIATSTGGTVSNDTLSLNVPVSFTSTSSAAVFQIHKLDATAFFGSAGAPSDMTRVGNIAYNLGATYDSTWPLTSFTAPLLVTMTYTDGDITGMTEPDLLIYRYDSPTWTALDNCVVTTVSNTISCETSHFSDFALFGDTPAVTPSPSAASSGSITAYGFIQYGCKDPLAQNYASYVAHDAALCRYASSGQGAGVGNPGMTGSPVLQSTVAKYIFEKDLKVGDVHADVKVLQKYLNAAGFKIASTGAGSAGKETTFFGPATKAALIKFQKAKSIKPAIGMFGPLTRGYVNSR